jgi:hypothetical protein
VLSDLEGISLIEEIISCGQVTQISNDVQALVLPLPFLINVKFNTVLTFSVLVNDSIASQEVFKIIESEKKKRQTSNLIKTTQRKSESTTKTNKYGLTRSVPLPIKREIRKRCGFGCVVCGMAIYDYEHIDPVFAEAKEHEPSKMALLCQACHGYVTRGMWSKDKIKAALKNPKCLQKGFSFGAFDIGLEHPKITLGNAKLIDVSNILEVFGDSLLKIEAPEEIGSPFRISALFHDHLGNEIFRITQNEWEGLTTNWDIETKGQRITIRYAPGRVILVIRAEPPNNLVVERLNMFYKGVCLTASEGKPISVSSPDGCFIGFDAPEIIMYTGISVHEGGITIAKF